VILGGEESGGYGYYGHLPERDGILSALLFVEMVIKKEKPLSLILDQMEKKFGRSVFKRVDFHQERISKKLLLEELTSHPPAALGGVPLREVLTIDGVKFIMEDESWLLIRPSGTEPKVRVYAEAPRQNQLERIIEQGEDLAHRVMKDLV
jgi:phosphomannomutase